VAQRCLLAFVLAVLLAAAPARAFDEAALEALIQQHARTSGAPGLVVAIRQGDGDPWVRAYGIADLEQGTPMQAATILPIASITKAFVGVAVLLLEQDGKLSLGDPLSRFLPDYPGGDAITLAELLTHTSGVANFVDLPAFADNQAKDWTPQQLVALFRDLPPTAAPGRECRYSDSGFILLGQVIEQASGMSFGDFVRQRVTQPLGMATTQQGSNAPIVPLRAHGYLGRPGAWTNSPYVSQSAPYAAGGMLSAAGDLVKLGAVLLRGGPLLDPAERAAMARPVLLSDGSACSYPLPGASGSYGYGLELVTFESLPGHRALGKSGVFPGFGAYIAAFENSDLTVAVLANGDGSLAQLVPLARDIAELLLRP
jgi:CubicO group peptidase (beta-lactamase class C family)